MAKNALIRRRGVRPSSQTIPQSLTRTSLLTVSGAFVPRGQQLNEKYGKIGSRASFLESTRPKTVLYARCS